MDGRRAVLDACVLIPMPLADTLLRLAEPPGLYEAYWSEEILTEVRRNLIGRFGLTERQASRRESAQRVFFPDASVTGYEHRIETMANHPKDRHVLAAAVQCGAMLIVSSNKKDFPEDALRPLGIECLGPSAFLVRLYKAEPETVTERLIQQAETLSWPLVELLTRLKVSAPGFVHFYCQKRKIRLG